MSPKPEQSHCELISQRDAQNVACDMPCCVLSMVLPSMLGVHDQGCGCTRLPWSSAAEQVWILATQAMLLCPAGT